MKTKKLPFYLDLLVDLAVIFAPVSLLPQLYTVWTLDDISGVSLYTWLFTLLATLPLIVYDISHRASKLVVMHTAIVFICLGIIIGIIRH